MARDEGVSHSASASTGSRGLVSELVQQIRRLITQLGQLLDDHRALGSVYVGATFLYCSSSFFMYPSTGRLTPFHLIAIQNLVLVSCGVALPRFLRQRLTDWYAWYLRLMLYSYVALVATGFRFALPYFPHSRVVPIIVFVVLPLGSWIWIERRLVPSWHVRLGVRSTSSHVV
jgi:hypothetical protein